MVYIIAIKCAIFRPRLIKNNFKMHPRLSGYISMLGLIFFVPKSLLGIVREWSREKFAIFVGTLDIQHSY